MSAAVDLRLTNADIEAMPEDGNRYEIIDGELFVSSAPHAIHQRVLMNIGYAFRVYLASHAMGEILPGVGIVFSEYDGVIPDLVFATHARERKALAGGRFRAAPEIVIEILSPGHGNERRDRHIKRSLYDSQGVDEYWIVDPENRALEMHRRDASGKLVFEQTFLGSDELTSPVLPGFSVPVSAFFE